MSNSNVSVNGFKQVAVYSTFLACGLFVQASSASESDCFSSRSNSRVGVVEALQNARNCAPAATAQGSNSVEVNNVQRLNITSRINDIRNANKAGGNTKISSLNPSTNKAAAGDGTDLMDKLGVFFNGNGGFGNRRSSLRSVGYDSDRQDTTLGVDYKFTDNFLLGTAFGYSHTLNSFEKQLGHLNSDSYIGSIYGSYFTDNGFFVDGILSGAGLDYDAQRDSLFSPNTRYLGKNEGTEYDASMTTGYNYSKGGLTLTPQLRVEHISTHITAMDEYSTNPLLSGLAIHTNEQNIQSFKTGLGGQISYAFSVPWGVIMPTARAEWVHEFQNNVRAISYKFLKDPTQTLSSKLTDAPDRDYVNLSIGASSQFAHGISAFVNYETLQGQNYLNNHLFSAGFRLEL